MDIWNNTTIQISSVVLHGLTVDMHKLLLLPYQMLWHKYDVHVDDCIYIYFIYAILFFTRTSGLSILALIFEFF